MEDVNLGVLPREGIGLRCITSGNVWKTERAEEIMGASLSKEVLCLAVWTIGPITTVLTIGETRHFGFFTGTAMMNNTHVSKV